MALFKRLEPFQPAAGARASGKSSAPATSPRPRTPWNQRFKWIAWAAGGVVVMAGAGYLVAHFVLFPSPMRSAEREVPHVLGLGEDDARRDIERQRLAPTVTSREPHPTLPSGTVVWQDPPPGVAVPRDYPIELSVSTGMPRIGVPNLRGFDPYFAQRLLLAAGLGLDAVDSADDVSLATGIVTGSSPAAGDSVPLGLRVLLHVAR